jgi:hypothetical protein
MISLSNSLQVGVIYIGFKFVNKICRCFEDISSVLFPLRPIRCLIRRRTANV